MRRPTTLALALLALVSSAAPAQKLAPPRKTVLVLMPVQPGRPAYDELLAGLIHELQEHTGTPPLVLVENLGEPNPGDRDAVDAQWAWLRTKYRDRPIDAVAVVGDPHDDVRVALGLPLTTPLAYVGSESSRLPRPQASTAVTGGELVTPFVRLVRRLLPATRRIAFVGGSSPADHVPNDALLVTLRAAAGDLRVDDLTGLSLPEMQVRARGLPEGTVLFLGITLVDRENRALSHRIVVSALKTVTTAPIFAPLDTAFGEGIVGGVMLSPEEVGAELAHQAARLLAGEAPEAVPVRKLAPRVQLDWRELRRLGVPESRVPEGALVLYREPSLWERNPGAILITAGVVIVQTALIAWLAIEQRRRRRTEAQLAERLRFEAIIHEVSERLASIAPDRLDEQLPDVLRTLGQLLGVDRCSLRRFVPERRSFAIVARWCRTGSTAEDDEEILLDDSPRELERVARGESVALRDVTAVALPPPLAAAAARQGTRGILGAPIRIDGRTVAVLVLGTRQPRDWSAHEVTAVRPVAEIVGTALVRQQQHREARAQRETLSHLDRVAVLGELATSLAHELNQPLGAILANAEAARLLLAADPPRLQDVEAALDDIVSDDERAGQIIRNMRAMIRRRPPATEAVDVREAVAGAVRLVQQDALLRHCRIEVRHGGGPHTALCDRIQLQQVVLNLLGNAIDACCEMPPADHVVTVETRPGGPGAVTLSVRDDGPGLGPEVSERMFEPFFSTKNAGLGVGLTICRSILETYGGSITAENAEGGGARFTVHLPAAPDTARAVELGPS